MCLYLIKHNTTFEIKFNNLTTFIYKIYEFIPGGSSIGWLVLDDHPTG